MQLEAQRQAPAHNLFKGSWIALCSHGAFWRAMLDEGCNQRVLQCMPMSTTLQCSSDLLLMETCTVRGQMLHKGWILLDGQLCH